MLVTHTIEETRKELARARTQGRTIGFVPTMGFLHEGHLSLIDIVRAEGAGYVAVSIFVNPTQFGHGEDFSRYPRNEGRDRELLESRGADLLFLPAVDTMYPRGSETTVHVRGVAGPLEGIRRPGHFDGVATIVLKLFDIVQPEIAAFGRKDAQQCAVIERMVRDLNVPVHLVFGETVRERDGLAMSSRNSYLSQSERSIAPTLYQALQAGREFIGTRDIAEVENAMLDVVSRLPGIEVDYLVLVDPETFDAPLDFDRELLLAGAVRVGRTRLIDNIRIPLNAERGA